MEFSRPLQDHCHRSRTQQHAAKRLIIFRPGCQKASDVITMHISIPVYFWAPVLLCVIPLLRMPGASFPRYTRLVGNEGAKTLSGNQENKYPLHGNLTEYWRSYQPFTHFTAKNPTS